MRYYVRQTSDQFGACYQIIDSIGGAVITKSNSKGGATNTCRAMNKRDRPLPTQHPMEDEPITNYR